MVSWSKQFLLEFIELFKSQEPVWYIKSKDYYNKGKRNECYDLLLTKIQSVDPTANRDTVTKKINNLRSSFRKEFKKVTVSKVSGASADDIYKPKLWYYNELLFLKDQEEPLDSTSNIDDDNDVSIKHFIHYFIFNFLLHKIMLPWNLTNSVKIIYKESSYLSCRSVYISTPVELQMIIFSSSKTLSYFSSFNIFFVAAFWGAIRMWVYSS